MRLAFRLFSACLLLEMMFLYHCFGQYISQVYYPNQLSIHNNVDHVGPSNFSLMDLAEILEGKGGEETSEEDSKETDSSDDFYKISKRFRLSIFHKYLKSAHPLLNFKKNTSPLFVLFHRWKYHLA